MTYITLIKMEYTLKSLLIRKDQEYWLQSNNISFSKFVRKLIDKEIQKK
jgi:hypothetical protein